MISGRPWRRWAVFAFGAVLQSTGLSMAFRSPDAVGLGLTLHAVGLGVMIGAFL